MLSLLMDPMETLSCHALLFFREFEGDERTYIDKNGHKRFSPYRTLLVEHNASEFDGWVVLNALAKETTELKIIKKARGLISLSFQCGVKTVFTVEVPQYIKFTCSKSH